MTNGNPHDQPHALYRFYDSAGALLYVGITLNPTHRWKKHRDGKPWWAEVMRIQLEQYPDRPKVLDAERTAILTEHPRYNIVHNQGDTPITAVDDTDELMLALAGCPPESGPWGSRPEHMPDDCHDHCVKAGIDAIYYPYLWRQGTAHYLCGHGHHWTCGWGHRAAGTAPQWRGRPAEVINP